MKSKPFKKTADAQQIKELEEDIRPAAISKKTLWVLFGSSMLVSIIFSVMAFGGNVPAWEKSLYDSINGIEETAVITFLARFLSDIVWAIVVAVVILLFVKKYFWSAYKISFAAGLTFAIIYVIEHIVQRGRPESLYGDEALLRATQGGYGFPSGHAGTISAILLALWPVMSWQLRTIALGLILGVLWSRIFLGVHLPLDVFAGFTIALVVYCALALLPYALRKKLKLA